MLRKRILVVNDGPDLRGSLQVRRAYREVQGGDCRNNTVELIQRRGLGKRKEDIVEETIDDVSSDQKERMAVPQAGPGIMLLTASMRLLYKDRRAWDLCQQSFSARTEKRHTGCSRQPSRVSSIKSGRPSKSGRIRRTGSRINSDAS